MSIGQDDGANSISEDRKLIEKMLLSSVQEQRRARRWSIFFRCLFFVWLFAGIGSAFFPLLR